jgi:hypothetical protein
MSIFAASKIGFPLSSVSARPKSSARASRSFRGLQQDPSALPRFHVRPGARLEGGAGGGDRAVEVLLPGFGDFRERLPVAGLTVGTACPTPTERSLR